MIKDVTNLISQMTIDEKIMFLEGAASMDTASCERLGIPKITFADGPLGVRIEDGGHDGVQTEQGMGNNSAAVCTLRGYFRCSLIDRDAVRGLKII